MKCVLKYMKVYLGTIILCITIKSIGTFSDFLIPYVLEHLLDDVAPTKNLKMVAFWGVVMLLIAVWVRVLNITANRMAVKVAKKCIFSIREDLFKKTIDLSGDQVDKYGLPSLTSRMTSDSYNIQNFMRFILTMGIRAPILMVGGIVVTLIMDPGLAIILVILVPIVLLIVIYVSKNGIPMFEKVQQAMDSIVRIMRENITGVRVVKALSKEDKETEKYKEANHTLFKQDAKASVVMAMPGPLTTLFLNVGLTFVVVLGAYRVNGGITQPGVILAFLTYFNMILNGVGGLNRLFVMLSKARASANRISLVLDEGEAFEKVYAEDASESYIAFENVNFRYRKSDGMADEYELENINFSLEKGSSLGIIGATGSGKTTIINLLMHFYEATSGTVFVDGKDVRSINVKELRRKFGVVFQDDVIFADSLYENVSFGRNIEKDRAMEACEDGMAGNFVNAYEDKLEHKAEIHGANLSGGQKQRILIARALAAKPEILVLDDSSSALDYKTDALLRHVIRDKYSDTTTIMIAQRISSIMSLDKIMVLDEGKIIGMGTHEELMNNCSLYKEIYDVQMT